VHALLFRKWKINVKGRDWYDFEWYVKKGIPLNLTHFTVRAHDSGDIPQGQLTADDFKKLLTSRIKSVDMEKVKGDVIRFIPDNSKLEMWSTKYFIDLAEHLKFVHS